MFRCCGFGRYSIDKNLPLNALLRNATAVSYAQNDILKSFCHVYMKTSCVASAFHVYTWCLEHLVIW
jgi:hypothetical protein